MASGATLTPALSLPECLLLCQAVATLGSQDWTKVAQMMVTSKYVQEVNRRSLTPGSCSAVFAGMLLRAGLQSEAAQTNLPNARATRKLVRKYYQQIINQTHANILTTYAKQEQLVKEIQAIENGERDEAILNSLDPSVRARLVSATTKPTASPPASPSRARKSPRKVATTTSGAEAAEQQQDEDKMVDVKMTGVAEEDGGAASEGSAAHEDEAEEEGEENSPRRKSSRASKPSRKSARAKSTAETKVKSEDEASEGDAADKNAAADDVAEEEEEEAEIEGEEEEKSTRSSRRRGKPTPPAPTRRGKRRTSEGSPAPISIEERVSKRAKTEEFSAEELQRFKKSMNILLDTLTSEPFAYDFKTQVTKRDAPAYFDAVLRPISFKEIRAKVKTQAIKTPTELMRDVALMCANAVQFNPESNEVTGHARSLWKKFEELMNVHLSMMSSDDD